MGERLVRNCWAREPGHLAILVGVEESRVGARERKDWSMSAGEWWDFFQVAGSKQEEVRERRVWKMAWVAALLLMSVPT